ncbi:uncharacterized protein L969DRAFT_90379 [Mixia osmundae IAM 14324]|uniref:HMA domain-containing protein n=1 Tax=Mixia osmundae (strain CBS 9802 / IAM 14324 / JCM 22182 / KY 12970) TaxID=764103 RepID=G7E2B1_MIXOS|nr:uncharacterized protein L969DRAFT_90379 [Mixia osmundae IAM 14324]KEI36844.1 hypothetical protein L969DRAFT_90379 [Mixia osmundae IAM 14324]GAA96971.1 hypothetical protein E5Q_03645 [Mixia osmundae IAM 14324]
MSITYQFNVAMSCGGCSGAIKRVLDKTEGIQQHTEDLPSQLVTVVVPSIETPSFDVILEKIRKTGKTIHSGGVQAPSNANEITPLTEKDQLKPDWKASLLNAVAAH